MVQPAHRNAVISFLNKEMLHYEHRQRLKQEQAAAHDRRDLAAPADDSSGVGQVDTFGFEVVDRNR